MVASMYQAKPTTGMTPSPRFAVVELSRLHGHERIRPALLKELTERIRRDGSERGKGTSVRREAEEGRRFECLIPVADEVRGPDRRRAVVGLGPGIVPRDRSEEGNHE